MMDSKKEKKLGRIDVNNTWEDIKEKWLNLYFNKEIIIGLSCMKEVTHKDEWLCEAYLETDYSQLTQENFEQTIKDYLAYLIKNGELNEIK